MYRISNYHVFLVFVNHKIFYVTTDYPGKCKKLLCLYMLSFAYNKNQFAVDDFCHDNMQGRHFLLSSMTGNLVILNMQITM